MDLTGKTVIVTGASRGIGAATARVFADAGAHVALLARSTDQIAALAQELGPKACAFACDVSDMVQMQDVIAQAEDQLGPVEVLIGNAGVLDPITPLSDADPDAWGRTIDINLKGVFNGMRCVLPGMIARGHGTIITVSSGAAHNPLEAWSSYCASKAGAYMLTRCADLENRDKGLRIMGLSPGTVATEMQRDIKASGLNPVSQLDWSDHIPPDWPARALLWMCGTGGDAHLGQDVSLRDPEIRRAVGLS